MTRENQPILTCEQLCRSRGVFYRKLPNEERLDAELIKLQRLASLKRGQVTIHVAMLHEGTPHLPVIESFLKFGKLSKLEMRSGGGEGNSVSSYFNSYVIKAIAEDVQDLIVVMVTQEGDVKWSGPDMNEHRGGYPKILYDREQYGNPPAMFGNAEITHIPPDRIVGFYYI